MSTLLRLFGSTIAELITSWVRDWNLRRQGAQEQRERMSDEQAERVRIANAARIDSERLSDDKLFRD